MVLDAEGVSDIDSTAVQELLGLVDELDEADAEISFARVRRPVHDMIERSGIRGRIGEHAVFLEVDDAVHHFLRTNHADDAESDP